jgi:hypothetical protein
MFTRICMLIRGRGLGSGGAGGPLTTADITTGITTVGAITAAITTAAACHTEAHRTVARHLEVNLAAANPTAVGIPARLHRMPAGQTGQKIYFERMRPVQV